MTSTTRNQRPTPPAVRRATLAAPLLAATLLAAGACGVTTDSRHDTQDFDHSGTQLTIEAATSEVTVVAGDGPAVRVERWLDGTAAEQGNSTWSLSDGKLQLQTRCEGIVVVCGSRFQVSVPRTTAVAVRTSAGAVTVSGLGNDVSVDSDDGHVQLNNTAGRIRVHTRTSDVTGRGLRSPSVDVDTEAGNLDVRFATAPTEVKLHSTHRDATLALPAQDKGYHVVAESKNPNAESRSEVPDAPASPWKATVTSDDGNAIVVRA